jgi:hypothetical protein
LKALSAKVAQEGLILSEDQLQALERAKQEKQAHGEIETEHPGYLGSQDTFYVGTLKGVGRIYQQTFIDTFTRVAVCKLYDRKHALTAADTQRPGAAVLRGRRRAAPARADRSWQRILRQPDAA